MCAVRMPSFLAPLPCPAALQGDLASPWPRLRLPACANPPALMDFGVRWALEEKVALRTCFALMRPASSPGSVRAWTPLFIAIPPPSLHQQGKGHRCRASLNLCLPASLPASGGQEVVVGGEQKSSVQSALQAADAKAGAKGTRVRPLGRRLGGGVEACTTTHLPHWNPVHPPAVHVCSIRAKQLVARLGVHLQASAGGHSRSTRMQQRRTVDSRAHSATLVR